MAQGIHTALQGLQSSLIESQYSTFSNLMSQVDITIYQCECKPNKLPVWTVN